MNAKSGTSNWRRNAYLFVLGQGLTMFGTMMVHYAITWHVTLQTKSSPAIALFSVAMVLPMFFISPFGGVWADRHNRKLIINISLCRWVPSFSLRWVRKAGSPFRCCY
jgi:DHA3 family macrolide efflux protein-like MFS transporter